MNLLKTKIYVSNENRIFEVTKLKFDGKFISIIDAAEVGARWADLDSDFLEVLSLEKQNFLLSRVLDQVAINNEAVFV